jgi:hypothetical protein
MSAIRLLKKFFLFKSIVTGNINKNDIDGVFHRVWGYIVTNQIYGDYLEFGVYKGDTMLSSHCQYIIFRQWMKNEICSSERWRKKQIEEFYNFHASFYGFDSFEGIPENDEDKVAFNKGTYCMSKEFVEARLLKNGVKSNYLHLIKSYFSHLSDTDIPTKASVIHIDSDLFESAKQALDLCKDSIQQGTIILFDDYNCFNSRNDKGERKALLEFAKNSGFELEKWFSYKYVGQAFICHLVR